MQILNGTIKIEYSLILYTPYYLQYYIKERKQKDEGKLYYYI